MFEFAVEIAMLKTMRGKIAINHSGTEFQIWSFFLLSKARTVIVNKPEYRTSNLGITKASNVNGAIATLESATVRNKVWKIKEPLCGDLAPVRFELFPEPIWQEYITTLNRHGSALQMSDCKEVAKKSAHTQPDLTPLKWI